MSRADEIAQGLREEGGALIGGLCVEEFAQGWDDYEASREPPRITSPSYDIGRMRASEKAEADRNFQAGLERKAADGRSRMRAVLKDHPEALAQYEAGMVRLAAQREGR